MGAIRPSAPSRPIRSSPPADLFAERNGAFGAAVDPALLARLDLKVGDRVTVGARQRGVAGAASISEPDKIADGIGFGPRLLVSQEALRATGLVQPGSLVRWTYRLTLPPALSTDEGLDADRGGGEPPPAGGRLEHPHAAQCRSALCPQHRALHPVPDPRRPDRPARRRRRRRQCGARLRRPQARLHRHPEEPRRAGRAGGAALPHAGDADRRRRHRHRPRRRRRPALRRSRPSSAISCRSRSQPTLAWTELGIALLYGVLTALVFAHRALGPRP